MLTKRLDEAFWVLEVEFTFRVGEELLSGGPGTFVLVPGGVAHAFACTSAGLGRPALIFAPRWRRGVFPRPVAATCVAARRAG